MAVPGIELCIYLPGSWREHWTNIVGQGCQVGKFISLTGIWTQECRHDQLQLDDSCCPWSHGLRPKKTSVAVPPAPVRVPSQRPLASSVASVTSVANDKGDNEIILGAVHRSPGICLTAEENPRKPQLGDYLMKELCDQSSSQMSQTGSLPSKWCR